VMTHRVSMCKFVCSREFLCSGGLIHLFSLETVPYSILSQMYGAHDVNVLSHVCGLCNSAVHLFVFLWLSEYPSEVMILNAQ
jgi:hypothetical protein